MKTRRLSSVPDTQIDRWGRHAVQAPCSSHDGVFSSTTPMPRPAGISIDGRGCAATSVVPDRWCWRLRIVEERIRLTGGTRPNQRGISSGKPATLVRHRQLNVQPCRSAATRLDDCPRMTSRVGLDHMAQMWRRPLVSRSRVTILTRQGTAGQRRSGDDADAALDSSTVCRTQTHSPRKGGLDSSHRSTRTQHPRVTASAAPSGMRVISQYRARRGGAGVAEVSRADRGAARRATHQTWSVSSLARRRQLATRPQPAA